MTEQGSGLRFDIYERVHLPEGLDGIEELEEAELVPHIQVVEEEDYAVIKGNLWLSGAYLGDSGSTGQTLEHLIPVEITMPQNRISRLEDVRVEIDQFDVELLTNRTLNVTGVLSLHGLEMLPFSERAEDNDPGEETVFSYEIPVAEYETYAAVRAEEPQPPAAALEEDNQEGVALDADIQELEEADNLTPVLALPEAVSDQPADKKKAAEDNNSFFAFPAYDEEEVSPSHQASPFAEAAEAAENEPKNEPGSEPETGERQEVKVAISGKSGLSHLQSLVRPPANRQQEEAAKEPPAQAAESVEWKKLFIRETDRSAFKKMRICIVQKEETIEEIADRYRISAREIAFYNQLGGQPVGEGQILIIPS